MYALLHKKSTYTLNQHLTQHDLTLLKHYKSVSTKSCPAEVEIVTNAINCVHDKLPFVYLGHPVGSNMRKGQSWNGVINNFLKRLALWQSRLLSIGGRLTLCKAVLGIIPLYYLSLFKAPSTILNHLESIRRRFFWGIKENESKIVWVNWQKVCSSKSSGGLGLGRLKDKNMSLLGKWKWRFCNEDDALWQRVIKEIYGPHGGFESNNSSIMCSGVWQSIVSNCKDIELLDIPFKKSMIKEVSSGSQTQFWSDIWCKEGKKLMEFFPWLYMLEINKECKVSDRWCLENEEWHGTWAWRSNPRGHLAIDLVDMIRLVGNLVLTPNSRDRWFWVLDPSGKFSVKALACLVESKSIGVGETNQNFIWNPWVPRKVNISIWRASMNRVPSRANLLISGVEIASARCVLCDLENEVEAVEHCLLLCPKAKLVWSKIWSWWRISSKLDTSLRDIILGKVDSIEIKLV